MPPYAHNINIGNTVHKPEILAPAGNISSLKAAVCYGADAVYLGIDKFNARINAENFTLENLTQWVDYAHLFGVKVYLTLNILIRDNEMQDAVDTVVSCVKCGIDAVIVQDFGLLNILSQHYPEVKIHCSTQMGIHNYLGALWAKEHNASRIILSRETTLQDIREIAKHTDIELEYFIMGALCVSFSGNCYYSSLVSGCSGNRGRCLQLCRKSYQAVNKGKADISGYLLSTKDLCLTDKITELVNAGVTSLKIEGRMKRPEYVAQAILTVKNALANGKADKNEIENLKTMFNRGDYSQGYLDKKTNYSNLIYPAHPAHKGIERGKIINISNNTAYIKTNVPIEKGDGFKIFRQGIEVGSAYGEGKNAIKYKGNIKIGDSVHITTSIKLIKTLENYQRKIPINIEYDVEQNKPIKIALTYNDISINYESDFLVSKANNQPLSIDDIKFSAVKLNDTDFEAIDIKVNLQDKVFIPKSLLNRARREAINKLKNTIIFKNTPKHSTMINIVLCKNKNNTSKYVQKNNIIIQFSDILLFNEKNNPFGDVFIYNPDIFEHLSPKPIFNAPIYLNLPIIANEDDIRLLLNQIDNIKSFDGIVVNNVYALQFAKTYDIKYICGTGMNIFNHFSLNLFNAEYYIGSPENYKDLTDMYVYSFGKFPLMTLKICTISVSSKTNCNMCKYSNDFELIDEFNKSIKIRRIKLSRCYFQLLDKQGLYLPKAERNNLVFFDFTDYNDKDVLNFFKRIDIEQNMQRNYFRKLQ